MDYCYWKKGSCSGIVAGIIWGWLAMAVNAVTGVFLFEHSIMHNLTAFAAGGAIFGLVVGGFLMLIHDRLPFKSFLSKAVLLSTSIWLTLRIGGSFLSYIASGRYHVDRVADIQGIILAAILGCILWAFWRIRQKGVSS